jgi:hypothetical protein
MKNKSKEEDIGEEVPLTIPTTEITASLDSLQLQEDRHINEPQSAKRTAQASDSLPEGSTQQFKLANDQQSDVSEKPGDLVERSKNLVGANSEQTEMEIRPDDVD